MSEEFRYVSEPIGSVYGEFWGVLGRCTKRDYAVEITAQFAKNTWMLPGVWGAATPQRFCVTPAIAAGFQFPVVDKRSEQFADSSSRPGLRDRGDSAAAFDASSVRAMDLAEQRQPSCEAPALFPSQTSLSIRSKNFQSGINPAVLVGTETTLNERQNSSGVTSC